MVPIRGIFFDFGNVIYHLDNQRLLMDLGALCGQSPEAVGRRMDEGAAVLRDYEVGQIDSEVFQDRISAMLGRRLEPSAFIRAFNGFFTPIESTERLIRQLKSRYLLGLVSNTNACHAEYTIRRCAVYPLFDAVSLSFEVGAFKPDPRLLEDTLLKLGLNASECVFIDDLEANIESARRMHMHGIVYTDHASLIVSLRNLGIEC
jgi:glucose-1-phosphatase